MPRINRSLVDSIIAEIRLIVGEHNDISSASDELILRLLNTAQEEAAQLLGRHYCEPLLTYVEYTIMPGTRDYPVPEDCFEERILKCECYQNTVTPPFPMLRTGFNEDLASAYSGNTVSMLPEAWMQIGTTRSVRVFPTPIGGAKLRMWYMKKPDDLVTSEGRIKSIVNDTTLEVDTFGTLISNDVDADGSHLSIIDGQTGFIKAILEVASVNTAAATLTFSTNPLVNKIEGVPVGTPSFLTVNSDVKYNIDIGDYLCLAPYTCIPVIRQPVINFIKQYAVALVQTNLGADHDVANKALDKMQKFVESMDSGKQNHYRVTLKSEAYGSPFEKRRRYPRPAP